MEQPIYNPSIPFTQLIPGGFGPGRLVRIQGSTAQNSNRFDINLMCGPSSTHNDVGLHLSTRFDEHVLVRNSKTHSWGPEERQGHLPLGRGQNFEILVLCEIHQYKIAINGQHFTDFILRVPLGRVTHIGIEGQVTVSLIQFEGLAAAAGPNNFVSPSAPMMPQPPPSYTPANSAPPIGWAAAPFPAGSGGATSTPYPPPPSYAPTGYQPGPNYGPAIMPGPYPPQQGYYGHPNPIPGQPQVHQGQGQGGNSGNSLQDKAGKMLGKVGLGGVANKIPGSSGGQQQHQGPSQGPGGPQYYGDVKPKKKDKTKDKIIKYGVPIAGVALAGYAVKKIID